MEDFPASFEYQRVSMAPAWSRCQGACNACCHSLHRLHALRALLKQERLGTSSWHGAVVSGEAHFCWDVVQTCTNMYQYIDTIIKKYLNIWMPISPSGHFFSWVQHVTICRGHREKNKDSCSTLKIPAGNTRNPTGSKLWATSRCCISWQGKLKTFSTWGFSLGMWNSKEVPKRLWPFVTIPWGSETLAQNLTGKRPRVSEFAEEFWSKALEKNPQRLCDQCGPRVIIDTQRLPWSKFVPSKSWSIASLRYATATYARVNIWHNSIQ